MSVIITTGFPFYAYLFTIGCNDHLTIIIEGVKFSKQAETCIFFKRCKS